MKPKSSPLSEELLLAIDDNDVDAIRTMLNEHPGLVNIPDSNGFTPLMHAVSALDRSVPCIRALLVAGGDLHSKSVDRYTALHMAVGVGGPSWKGDMPGLVIDLLLDAGVQLEAKQHWGWAALMRAVIEGSVDEVRALTRAGANPNHIFPQHTLPAFLAGRTTLMAAVFDPEKVQLLVGVGAHVAASDSHGDTVIQYAQHAQRLLDEEDKSVSEEDLAKFKERLRESIRILTAAR